MNKFKSLFSEKINKTSKTIYTLIEKNREEADCQYKK